MYCSAGEPDRGFAYFVDTPILYGSAIPASITRPQCPHLHGAAGCAASKNTADPIEAQAVLLRVAWPVPPPVLDDEYLSKAEDPSAEIFSSWIMVLAL